MDSICYKWPLKLQEEDLQEVDFLICLMEAMPTHLQQPMACILPLLLLLGTLFHHLQNSTQDLQCKTVRWHTCTPLLLLTQAPCNPPHPQLLLLTCLLLQQLRPRLQRQLPVDTAVPTLPMFSCQWIFLHHLLTFHRMKRKTNKTPSTKNLSFLYSFLT